MITGVMQAWKTPVVEADVDWIDLQKNNRDMEYTSWMEYLIKLSCAIYSIDPTEIRLGYKSWFKRWRLYLKAVRNKGWKTF